MEIIIQPSDRLENDILNLLIESISKELSTPKLLLIL
jgi:hypothetical protein